MTEHMSHRARSGWQDGPVSSARWLGWFGLSAGVAAWSSLHTKFAFDYSIDAEPSINALAHLDIGRALDNPPVMGPTSIVLRAPAVALVQAFDGDALAGYRAGSLACLLAASAVAAVLA